MGKDPSPIRVATLDDADAIAEIYAPSVTHGVASFEVVAPSPDEMRTRIASTLQMSPWLVYEDRGVVVGYAYTSPHATRAAYAWSLNSSVYVASSVHKKGIGRALYTVLFALNRLQGYVAVHAGITLPNATSVAFHEAMGFRSIGTFPGVGHKHGQWHDVGWWQLELAPRVHAPAPPIPWPALDATASLSVADAFASHSSR